ncbi:hypothetical protein LOTGIDRAFT_123580 [Lottia gigantea]|uniref:GPI ethanolamine phosphate transferase 1 n=1 Tax=Lottia gigantea TaxID=225164 RepID=V3ZGL6_LOTGI|nr:hypothetical protein LOTGIDRAFT_123580 [Lottia gigantea]ESO90338.1 hypothetical protein LOTGIDRAFT_123580 [Lottia gigantea]
MLLWQLIIAGVAVHLILFYSIFDIYFTSPLVHGMTPHKSEFPPPAKRLVLFVADGLRADKFYQVDQDGKSMAPYLRSIIETRGSWGVSHTRVPTETRPGHVALIAGFYEDVSAVAKGWKENPVEFDSVFNESRYTWSWGSPDVLPMFSKGASGDHVYVNCYSAELEDFGASDTDMRRLDTWVFDRVKEFFEAARKDEELQFKLNQDKVVFFLHLLGLDTTGHTQKPYSQAYFKNIEYVDTGIKDIEELIETYYNHDGQTAYIMSADHGMTDWGSHGAGHPSETLTPLVAWGAGVRGPQTQERCGQFQDKFCQEWGLNHLERTDVEQADITPLMSYLIGAAFPLNSVGSLPVDYLNLTKWQKAEALYSNARQIMEQFDVKMEQVKESSFSATFQYFKDLTPTKKLNALRNLKTLIKAGQHEQAISEGQELIQTILQGLNYYQTYNRSFLGTSIVSGFLGWMAFVLQLVLHRYSSLKYQVKQCQSSLVNMIFYMIGLVVITLLYMMHAPVMYYVYCLLPVVLWNKAIHGIIENSRRMINKNNMVELALSIVSTVLGLQILVVGFFYRELLSLVLLGMAVWPLSSSNTASKCTKIGWSISCLLLAIFPLLPLVGQNSNYTLVLCSGILQVSIGLIITKRNTTACFNYIYSNIMNCVYVFQTILVILSTCVVFDTKNSINEGQGLPVTCQIFSWTLLVLCPSLPLLSSCSIEERLSSLCLSFTALYQLMSITYEGLFLSSLCMLLYYWLSMENENSQNKSRKKLSEISFDNEILLSNKNHNDVTRSLEISDLRRTFFFIFLTLIGFFGTGNIASINSFDPSSVYCFLTVFNPFVMGFLMMVKNLIPLLIVTCVFRGVHVITRVPTKALFLLVLIMSDFMGLHFFFLVQDTGSWLDIGTSISHYIIVMTMIIFLILLFGLSQILMTFKLRLR